jgi:two-component system, sensor histidine kinase LadS
MRISIFTTLFLTIFSSHLLAENSIREALDNQNLKFFISELSPLNSEIGDLEREKSHLSIANSILYNELDPGFQEEISNRFISRGYSRETIWILIHLKNDTNREEFILNLENSHLDHVELFLKSQEKSMLGGDNLPFPEWIINEIRIAFPVHIPIGKEETLLLKIKTTSAVNIKLTLQEPKSFFKNLGNTKMLYGFFYGSVGIMIVYNFVIFLLIRERVYFFYSAAIFSNLILQMFLNGMDLYWMGYFPNIRNNLGVVYVGVSAFFGIMFAREFLQSRSNMPYLDKVMQAYAWISIVFAPILFFLMDKRINIIISNVVAQIFALMILYSIIRGIFLKIKQAKLFLVAWGFLLIGIILYTLLETGAVPSNLFTQFANQFGSIFEATILSLAMAERLRTLKREKEEARNIAFQNLEQVVSNRTQQLNQTLKDIQKDIQMAKRIQMDTLPDSSWSSSAIEFARIFQPMSIIGGDTFDLSEIRKGYFRVFLADATGHGVQAALITMAIRSEYQGIKRSASNPSELLKDLNETFMREYYSLNIIFSCCVLDIDTNSGKAFFSAAGHPHQVLVSKGTVYKLEKTGRIIGLSLDSKYNMLELEVKPKDRLYLYSDGILEQVNQEDKEFGESKLEDYLSRNHNIDIKVTISELESFFHSYRKNIPQSDDLTVLGIELKNLTIP